MPLLFAELTPLSVQAQLTIFSLLSLAIMVLTIHALWPKRNPTLDTQLAQFGGTIKTLETSVAALSTAMTKHATHEAEISQLQQKVAALESRREADQAKRDTDLAAQRAYTRETTREIFEELRNVSAAFAENTKSLERALGQVEGKIEGLTDRIGHIEIIAKKS